MQYTAVSVLLRPTSNVKQNERFRDIKLSIFAITNLPFKDQENLLEIHTNSIAKQLYHSTN